MSLLPLENQINKKSNHIKEYKTIYWPLFTSIYNKVNNIQLDNIDYKVTVFPGFCWTSNSNTEKTEPTGQEWTGVKKKHAGEEFGLYKPVHPFTPTGAKLPTSLTIWLWLASMKEVADSPWIATF